MQIRKKTFPEKHFKWLAESWQLYVLILPAIIGENGIFIAEVMAWAGADMILIPSYFLMIKRLDP